MYVAWDPENGESKSEWQFDPGEVTRKNAMLIEKHYGQAWDRWLAGLMLGEISARAVLLWYMMHLEHPNKVRFDDIPDFRVRQLKTEMGSLELKDLWKRAERMKLDPDQRDAFENQFEYDMRDALIREGRDPNGFHIDGKVLELEAGDLPKPA